MDKKPTKGKYLETILRSAKTIFSIKDVSLMWREDDESIISIRLNKYQKAEKLIIIINPTSNIVKLHSYVNSKSILYILTLTPFGTDDILNKIE